MARNVHGDLLMGSGRSGLYLRSRREPIQNQSGGTKRRDTANWANSGRFGLIVQLRQRLGIGIVGSAQMQMRKDCCL